MAPEKHDKTRFPLAWPQGWPRNSHLKSSRFKTYKRSLTISDAVARLEAQLSMLGAEDAMMSSNLKLGVSGIPLSGQAEPMDRGVAVYFVLKGHDRVLACDAYLSAAGNIAAIAAHIDALRRIERYGVGSVEQAFAGYAALDPPNEANRPTWRLILGFKGFSSVTVDDVKHNYRQKAKLVANNEDALKVLNLARDAALRELGA